MDAEIEKMLIDATPMARRGKLEEIVNICTFLASDEANYLTGTLWLADGSITMAKDVIGTQTPEQSRKIPQDNLPKTAYI